MSGQNQSIDTSAAAVSNIFATGSVVDSLAHHPHSSTGQISTAKLEQLESVYKTNHSNSGSGDQSHTIKGLSHPVWLSLCHVANLFGVPSAAAKGSKTSSAAPACRIVSFLGSGAARSSGSRLHATALKAEEAIRWEKEAREGHSRVNDLQSRLDAALVDIQQLQMTAGNVAVQRLTIQQIIASGNVDTVTSQSPVSAAAFHGVSGAHDLSENWLVEYELTPLALNWVHSRVLVQLRLHFQEFSEVMHEVTCWGS